MSDESPDPASHALIEQALTGGAPQHVGSFRFYFVDERWEWSPEVAQMHGYPPAPLSPTTDQVLSHKHPDDYWQVAATLEQIRKNEQAFSTRHRIIDLQQCVHHVIVVGDRLYDDDGMVVGTHGFYVDVSATMGREHRESVADAVDEIAKSRGNIEQAKGMLMLIYGLNADAAFELLKWRSQETNIKLRILAEQIVTDFSTADGGIDFPLREVYDRLLLTAHQRIAP